jgi:hypothetical protein
VIHDELEFEFLTKTIFIKLSRVEPIKFDFAPLISFLDLSLAIDIGCIHIFVFLPFYFILIFVAEGLADMIKNETFRYQFLHFI